MHFPLTSPQLLVGAFALTLGIIFALATVVQIRLQRARPFRNDSSSESDPGPSPNDSFSQPEFVPVDEQTVFADFGFRYNRSPSRQARVQNTIPGMRE